MTPDMQQALTERRQLIENRAEVVLDTALHTQEPWTKVLGEIPADGREQQQWRRRAVVIAAYRDRYKITGPTPLGAEAEGTAQKMDQARAVTALQALVLIRESASPIPNPCSVPRSKLHINTSYSPHRSHTTKSPAPKESARLRNDSIHLERSGRRDTAALCRWKFVDRPARTCGF